MQIGNDSEDDVRTRVPMNRRQGPVTMGLLWITMVTAFPTLMIGFEWYKSGLSLPQVIACCVLSCAMLLCYSIPATQLGARTGLGYTALSRSIFGRWGARYVTFNIIWMFVCFYGLMSFLMAESLAGIFHWTVPIAILGAAFALIMSVNNLFGFKGVANFARYIAAPALIGWVGYTFIKSCSMCPSSVLTHSSPVTFAAALTTVSGFVIGYAVWGNEMDYWKHGRPKVKESAFPLTAALVIGQVLFPVTGWMVARVTGITEYGAASAMMTYFSFGGIGLLAAIVLGASYFAANDSNLLGSVQACENLKPMPHRTWAIVLALAGAVCAALFSLLGAAKSIESIACLNCIMLPTPTVVMIGEWFLISKVWQNGCISSLTVPDFGELPFVRWPAVIALASGLVVGLLTAGVIPGTERFHVGIASVQTWLTALMVYIPLRMIEHKKQAAAFSTSRECLEHQLLALAPAQETTASGKPLPRKVQI